MAPPASGRFSPLLLGIALLACAVIAAAGLLIPRVPQNVLVDLGGPIDETTQLQSFYVFYGPERWEGRSFRWTNGRGALMLPNLLHLRPLELEIVACGCRPDGATVPVRLLLNEQPVATIAADGFWRRYQVPVPPTISNPDDALVVDLRSPTRADSSGRSLGLAVDTVLVRQSGPTPLADFASVLIGIVALVAAAAWRRNLWLVALAAGIWLLLVWVYQPLLLPLPVVLAITAAGIGAIWAASGRSALAAAAGALAGTWLTLSLTLLGHWIVDDAFISFRYAQQFVAGNGLVFNSTERVEGYTNFLWTVLLAGAMALGGDPILVSAALTLGLAFVGLALTALLARRLVAEPWWWAAPALLALSSPFLHYTARGSGMETGLFAVLVLAALLALHGGRWAGAGLLTALAMLTRPDGAVLALAGGLFALWCGWRDTAVRRPTLSALGPALRYSAVTLVIFVPYFLWRWNYYGYLLPNTFYVKVGSGSGQVLRGLAYLWDFGAQHLLPLSAAAGLVAGLWPLRRSLLSADLRGPALLAGFVALFSGYIAAVGGDWMPEARFGVPLLAPLAVLTAWGLAGLTRTPLRPLAVPLALALAVALAWRLPPTSSSNPKSLAWAHNYAVGRYREVGIWIRNNTDPAIWMSTSVAGAMPFYAERSTIDGYGLTDAYIAHKPVAKLGTGRPGHEKTDPDYVLGRRPEIIPFLESAYLWDQPTFRANYHLQTFDGGEGRGVRLYIRNDVQLDGGRQTTEDGPPTVDGRQ